MRVAIASTREDCFQKVKNGIDIVLFRVHLFDVLVFTTNRDAMKSVYITYDWEYAKLNEISTFCFFPFSMREVIDILTKKISGIEIIGRNSTAA